MFKSFVDKIFLKDFVIKNFKNKYPDEEILYISVYKALRIEEKYSFHLNKMFKQKFLSWLFAKRGTLILTDKRIFLGTWEFYFNDISYFYQIKFPSIFSGSYSVLEFFDKKTNSFYQIGTMFPSDISFKNISILPTKVNLPAGQVKFKLFIRFVIIASLIHWFLTNILHIL